MHLEDISVTKSSLHARAWKLHLQINGLTYDGWFDDFGGFLTAIQDAATFFAYRAGKMSLAAANESASRQFKRPTDTKISPLALAALKAAYIHFGDWTFDWPGRIQPAGQVLLGQMRDAIAAATGRTPQEVQDDYGTRARRAAISKAQGAEG